MVNGAPGSAWASERVVGEDGRIERVIAGLPADDATRELREDDLFDLASLTKVITTVCALRLVERGEIGLDAPIADVIEVGTGPDASGITLRHLLTHTSGLPAECPEWRIRSGEDLLGAVLSSSLQSSPGRVHRYSDVGFIAAGVALERVSGRGLDALVAEAAADLGAATLTYAPAAERSVATEVQPHRGAVRGQVHDELAHALGRPVGHAGLFGSLDDVVALARMFGDAGEGRVARVLSARSVRSMTTPVAEAGGYEQAIGLRVRDRSWMGRIDAVGHTGFTGTAFAVQTGTGAHSVLLTNRVHPTRIDTDMAEIRRSFFAPSEGTDSGGNGIRYHNG